MLNSPLKVISKTTLTNKILAAPIAIICLFLVVSSCSGSDDDMPVQTIEEPKEPERTDTEEVTEAETPEETTQEPPEEVVAENPEPEENQDATESGVTGTIYLSGEEAAAVGDSLVVAHIAIGIAGNERTVVLTDEKTPIGDEVPQPTDEENNFIIVALDLGDKATADADKALSINISVDGIDFKLACALPIIGNFIKCGDRYQIDFEKKEIVFDETTVINVNTDAILKMTGTVKW